MRLLLIPIITILISSIANADYSFENVYRFDNIDMIKNNEISLIVNTTEGKRAIKESYSIRAEAVHRNITYYTTLTAAKATCDALDHLDNTVVNSLQDLHDEVA